MAQELLEKQSPKTYDHVLKVLDVLKQTSEPQFLKAEKDHVFVEACQFADMLKRNGGKFQEDWHYTNKIVFHERGKSSKDFAPLKPPKEEITTALYGLYAWLGNQTVYQDSWVYPQVMKATNNNLASAESYAL